MRYWSAVCHDCWGSKNITIDPPIMSENGMATGPCQTCGETGRDMIPWSELFVTQSLREKK